MILSYKSYTVSSSALPANWVLTSNNTCATAEVLSGTTTDGNINLVLQLQNGACFNGVEYTLTVESDCGRVENIKFSPVNLCTGWTASITNDNFLNFQAHVTGSGTYSYQWAYNTNVFEPAPSNNPSNGFLSLQVISGEMTHDSEVITLTVSDAIGCVQTVDYVYSVCQASGNDSNHVLSCIKLPSPPAGTTGVVNRASRGVVLNFTSCTNRTINWSTLEFSNVPANVFAVHSGSGNVIFYANTQFDSNFSPLIQARVKDSLGVWSEYIGIGLTIPECIGNKSPITIDENYVFAPGEATIGAIVYQPLEQLVATESALDWSTFTFVAGAGQTLVSSTSLTTPNAGVVLGADRRLKYTVTALPVAACADTVKWRITTVDNLISKEGRVYFDYSVATAPTAVANTACAVCGQTTTVQPLANDTGIIDADSFTVTVAPTKGSYQFNNPDLTYTALLQSSGTDILTYKVANPDGNFSNTANVTYTIYCAGEDNSLVSCKTTVDFTDYLSSWASSGGTWTQAVTNPATVSLGTPTAVPFAGKPSGTYVFYYTVTSGGCTDVMTLTIYLIGNSTNDTCANATVMVYPTKNTVTGEILSCDTDSTLETVASSVQNPPSWNTVRGNDHWFKFTTTSILVAEIVADSTMYATGISNPQLALYRSTATPCAVDDFVLVANGAETNGGKYLKLTVSGLTASTMYWIRLSAGGTTSIEGKYNLTLKGIVG